MVFVGAPVARPVQRLRGIVLALLATAAVASSGCSGKAVGDAADAPIPDGMTIVGLVQNETFVPIAGAQVALRLTNFTAVTDAGGLFTFEVPLAPYLVDVAAEGFQNATLNAEPQLNVSLNFVLVRPAPVVPAPVTTQYTGYFQCAFEALIIPGSCDILLDGFNQSVFEDQSQFVTGLGPRWSTVVVDVDFQGQPGLDGLHVTARGRNDADQLGDYEQYGQFNGQSSFTFRLEPGQSYPGGDREVPANATSLQVDVYPEGYLWHPGGVPVLGVGAAVNVSFDVYVTVFFVDPAPAGFSMLA